MTLDDTIIPSSLRATLDRSGSGARTRKRRVLQLLTRSSLSQTFFFVSFFFLRLSSSVPPWKCAFCSLRGNPSVRENGFRTDYYYHYFTRCFGTGCKWNNSPCFMGACN
ncbi:hypothetical protein BO70DRAFT_161071 [Aspergillus heteromorphus CBS 117.55]|uniref:Uncharacterized protein n=1 Tax=Aspergillus heteromorphus CBS 117.55 TaxID=1448321 RepID=A0A317WRK7_9EURO|nr:uncharacterized protein BO70DRAFT_161071 [Aspergillus heteromorphus CBS 117.55]PWY89086.1 hypothetical protein BO70DRAFT_161071 [Aspergillus heteromorphus CBS 117.55]